MKRNRLNRDYISSSENKFKMYQVAYNEVSFEQSYMKIKNNWGSDDAQCQRRPSSSHFVILTTSCYPICRHLATVSQLGENVMTPCFNFVHVIH